MSQTGAANGGRQAAAGARGDVLAEYRRRKLELAEVIRAAMQLAERRRDQERVTAGHERWCGAPGRRSRSRPRSRISRAS